MEHGYEIKIPQFEGPFDLLLFFIDRDELAINEISITKITTDFLSYIQEMQSINMEVASEFILMAATLMRIKVKTLLPRPQLDEEGEEIDFQRNLVQKLLLYKAFKEVCQDLRPLEDHRMSQHKRGNIAVDLKKISETARGGDELESFDLYKLMLAYEKMMQSFSQRTAEAKHTVAAYPYTIEQQKSMIASLVEINKKLDFQTIVQNSENKVHFVYNFLAILEMLQQQLIEIQMGLGYNNFWLQPQDYVPDPDRRGTGN